MRPELRDYIELTDRFEAQSVDAGTFTHVDHIGVACRMLKKYDFLEAAARYGTALRAIATKAGAPDKFNTTLTLAFLGVLSERMAETPHETFAEFLEKNQVLVSRSLISTWYSSDRVGSQLARRAFLMPDRFRN
ncbi:MAG: hypothetical protein K5905_29025 [Roseibium sp.]|uniref:hypothetical protein n=1 Tax=Roseibium sp. TaxID=1936156 RepID=UPI0026374487|nr:hypothetical protein [Roseibium sp.]MCV0429505.1 hypothetical protein [Roseibium sp.]